MAKQRLQRIRRLSTRGLLLLTLLAWGLGTAPSRAAGQISPQSTKKKTQAAGQKKAAAPAKPSKTPTQRQGDTSQESPLSTGKRDPFKLPEAAGGGNAGAGNVFDSAPPGGVLPQGQRGLLISHLQLEGVVREQTSNKMIAVVTNETKRAYFLTEGDAVYNGVVSKITPDAVYFKENVLDSNGKVWTRDVMKRLGSAPGEGR